MKSAEIIKRLRRDGWRLHSTKGSHRHYVHDSKPGRVTVVHPREAVHAEADLPAGRLGLEGPMRYLVELDGSDPGVGYDVTVPDLPGCTSAGDDLDQALRNAKEAISLHVEAMIADGEPVPAPATEPAPPSAPGALIGFVEVDLHTPSTSNKATRLSVTIPEHALALIDFAAKRAGTSRSEFLTRSALTCIGQDARRNA